MNHFMIDGRYEDLLKFHHIDPAAVLTKAQLPLDIFKHDQIKMSEDEYYRFLTAIGEVSADPGLAVKMATDEQIESFSPPVFAAYCSQNGARCISRLAQYKKLIGPMNYQLTADEKRSTETIALVPGDESLSLPNFLVEGEFAFLVGMLKKASQKEISPVKITMVNLPTASSLADYTGITPVAGSENSITFKQKDLEEPFLTFSPAMWSYFEPELQKRLSDLAIDDSVSARVRSALAELLPGGVSSIEEVAEKLGYSKRSLQRKLKEENTSFQKQLNSVRESLAIHYIRSTNLPAAEIAFLLGYAEVNSFLRAFNIWTGKSVSEYKKSME